ncbi:MAG: NAD(P)-dependent glycerol-3-phosphate dehydrogenase [Acidobacteriota bacterium]|nr:MAG: NAD(P)-dependent glycerol-3-phosphate dehydrogenase [Acidobacteriota bacterium]
MDVQRRKLGIIGAGGWGTALALHTARLGFDVQVWMWEADLCEALKRTRENQNYLPGFTLPEDVRFTSVLADAVSGPKILILAAPSHVMRGILRDVKPHLDDACTLLNAAKGIESDTLLRMSEVAYEVLGEEIRSRFATLSGPSFAAEVASNEPTVVAVASENEALASGLRTALSSRTFRIYSTTDIVGVELGGALKNVIALATGIVQGLGLGYNTQAALVTRGLVEITRLAVARGARMETLMGAAGMGDLFLTCTGPLSRNRQVGERLGRGESLKEILASMRMVAEGVQTAKAAHQLAEQHGIEMPITKEVFRVLYEGVTAQDALETLLAREPKEEGLRIP